jgi:hypothetical protein
VTKLCFVTHLLLKLCFVILVGICAAATSKRNPRRSLESTVQTRSDHQVWQEGFHPKALMTDETMLQKIVYLHRNPVARGWVAMPEDWRYSSAHEWRESAAGAALRPMALTRHRNRVSRTSA